MPRLMLLIAAWSLVVVPSLCRAEALTACCVHEEPTPASTPIGCCSDHQAPPDDEPRVPESPTRECGLCVDVCKAIAKPGESLTSAGFELRASPWDAASEHDALAWASALDVAFTARIDSLRLPCHASGLPLRI